MSARTTARTRFRRIAAIAAGVGLVVAGVGIATVDEDSAKAAAAVAALDGFDPANIIDDAVMFNGATMSASDIQTFLNGKQPTCAPGATCLKSVKVDIPAMAANPMCKAVAPRSSQTAAQVIAAVGQACNVNPQVILVMLQKEQTLVTGRTPYSGETVSLIYRKATGLGCPDTAACDPSKYGLFNQLYGVAYWLVRYTTPPGTTGPGWTSYNWFPVGQRNGVLYNPNAACGAGAITIKNKATASLYYYTPYQPNAASLAAGWGLGDGCSSYGNRNFYLYFTTWFGSTHYTVTGAVKTYWSSRTSTFGDPIGNAVAVAGGTYQRFAKGTIYSSSAGTWGVQAGALLTEYTALGGPTGKLGWPKKAMTTRKAPNAGSAQGFQNGTIYTSSSGTAAVLASLYPTFAANGYETGALGYPVSDAVTGNGGTVQTFQRGAITAAGSTTTTVTGATWTTWKARGAQTGTLGWPTSAVTTVTAGGKKGTVQSFATGYVTVQGTARSVTGPLAATYRAHGGPTGVLGWPTGSALQRTDGGGGWVQVFTGGRLYWGKSVGVHAIKNGPVLSLYNARGGTTGSLGWLVVSASDRHGVGGDYAQFQGGRIYHSGLGTYAVLGAILEKWQSKGGTGGVLGWPTSNARGVNGATVQTFQHGTISWTKAGGAKASKS
ncbi:LGFP repeat-containing protein [Amnibacterium kyonggiense]